MVTRGWKVQQVPSDSSELSVQNAVLKIERLDIPAFGGGLWVAPRSGKKSISWHSFIQIGPVNHTLTACSTTLLTNHGLLLRPAASGI